MLTTTLHLNRPNSAPMAHLVRCALIKSFKQIKLLLPHLLFALMLVFLLCTVASGAPTGNSKPQKGTANFTAFSDVDVQLLSETKRMVTARIATHKDGTVYECFSDHPQRVGIPHTHITRVKFESGTYFCTPGFAALERAALERRIATPDKLKRLFSGGQKKMSSADPISTNNRVLNMVATRTQAETIGAQNCALSPRLVSAAARAPRYGTLTNLSLGIDLLGSGIFKNVALEDDDDYDEWGDEYEFPDVIDVGDTGGVGVGPPPPQCIKLLNAMLAVCRGAGPAMPECIAGAVLLYLICLGNG